MHTAPDGPRNLHTRAKAFGLLGTTTLLGLALGVAGCPSGGITGGDLDASTTGTGGTVGSGGSPGTGGTPGSGGTVSSGGTVGSGGTTVGSGGAVGTGGAQGTGGSGTGGRVGTGGAGTGGTGTGGRIGTGGTGTGGRGTGGAGTGGRGTGGSTGSGGSTTTTTCASVGATTTVNATIVVRSGETYDGGCKRFIAAPNLGDGSQLEGQDPVFDVNNNGTLINVVLGFPAADGIHTQGNATLRNITWEDIGEDALTIEGSGTVTLDGGSSAKGSDKTFQINAASTFRVSNFKATTAGKFARQNGGTTFKVAVFIDRCDISNMSEAIFRTDSSTSTVSMTNTRYSKIGDSLFIGVAAANITQSNNTQY